MLDLQDSTHDYNLEKIQHVNDHHGHHKIVVFSLNMVWCMVNSNDHLLEFFKKEIKKILEGDTVEFFCKLIDETICFQGPKNTIPFLSFIHIVYIEATPSLEPSVGKIWCYWEDAFIQK